MLSRSTLSPHATPFVSMSTEQISHHGNFANVRAFLLANYNPALERIVTAIDSCQSTLNFQRYRLEQHEKECARHYNAFIRWKYFERYDEPSHYQDTECAQYLADTRNLRCTKCSGQSLELKQQLDYTSDKYMRLITIHNEAVDEIIPSPVSMD